MGSKIPLGFHFLGEAFGIYIHFGKVAFVTGKLEEMKRSRWNDRQGGLWGRGANGERTPTLCGHNLSAAIS